MRIDITDWHFQVEGTRFAARPSARSVARQLWATLLAAVLVLVILWQFGLPPGSRQLQRRIDRVQDLERQARDVRRQAQRMGGSATASDPRSVARQGAQSLHRQADELDARVSRERAALANAQPTLGPAGDAMVWIAVVVLVLVGLALPLLAPLARVHLTYEGPPGRGTLTIRQWFIVGRSRRFDAAEFIGIGLHVQRLITRRNQGGALDDHGWVWQVILFTAEAANPAAVTMLVDHHPTLPPDSGMVTPRCQVLVRYLEAVTALERGRPVVSDVAEVTPTWKGMRWSLRSRRV